MYNFVKSEHLSLKSFATTEQTETSLHWYRYRTYYRYCIFESGLWVKKGDQDLQESHLF